MKMAQGHRTGVRTLLALLGGFLAATAHHSLAASDGTLSAGNFHSAAADADSGELWAFGKAANGQIGGGFTEPDQLNPFPVRVTHDGEEVEWRQVSAGGEHTLAIDEEGRLWAWGNNRSGQLGIGNDEVEFAESPVRVGTESDWVAVSAGGDHSLALRDDGSGRILYAWGRNSTGQLGANGTTNSFSPLRVYAESQDERWRLISAGGFFSAAIRADGTLWTWGDNLFGELGVGSDAFRSEVPVKVGTATDWIMLAAGRYHILALKENGTLYSWGINLNSETGRPETDSSLGTPARVGGAADWVAIAAGGSHSLGIRGSASGGTLWGWGSNIGGRLGTGSSDLAVVAPMQLHADAVWIEIAAGLNHSLARRNDGVIFTTGSNNHGQLGVGSTTPAMVFAQTRLGLPDLQIDLIEIDPENADFTGPIGLNLKVANAGGGEVQGDFRLQAYLSLDTQIGGSDIVVFDQVISGGLAGQSSVSVNGNTFQLPNTTDAYFLIVEVDGDNAVEEVNEANNREGVQVFQPTQTVDFDVVGGNVSMPAQLRPGAEMSFSATIKNIGSDFAGGLDVPVEVVLSTSPDFDQGAAFVSVGSKTFDTPLAFGEQTSVTGTFQLPANISNRTYYAGIRVNLGAATVVAEENQGNNTAGISDGFDFRPDFVAQGISVSGQNIQPGDEVGLDFSIKNTGARHLGGDGAVRTRLVLTRNATVGDADDLAIQLRDPVSNLLKPFEAFTGDIPFNSIVTQSVVAVIPDAVPAGQYHFAIHVEFDDQYAEVIEENNFFHDAVTFDFFPDFVITQFDVPDATIVPGGSIGLKITGRNQGASYAPREGEPPMIVRVRLVKGPYWGTDGSAEVVELSGSIQVPGTIASGQEFSDSIAFDIPQSIPSGIYYLVAKADTTLAGIRSADINESDETNNIAVSPGVFPLLADLKVTEVQYSSSGSIVRERGDPVLVQSVTFTNDSDYAVTASELSLQVRLSQDHVWGNLDDVLLEDLIVPLLSGLAPGEVRTIDLSSDPSGSTVIAANTPPGQYFLAAGIDVDDSVEELDESNNFWFSPVSNVTVDAVTLGEAIEDHLAVGKRGFSPLVGGVSSWFAAEDSAAYHDGIAGAQSGPVSDGEETFFEVQVSVTEVSEVSFWWRVDSELSFDQLIFTINGERPDEITPISGQSGWKQEGALLTQGTNLLRWTYRKDDNVTKGLDRAWVDSVEIRPADLSSEGDPDLTLNSAAYSPGQYVVQRDRLPFVAGGANIGGSLGIPIPSKALEVSTILSRDRVWGNDDDIVLGIFDLAEPLSTQDVFVYQEEPEIPSVNRAGLVIPPSASYYLGLRIDPNALYPEASEANNTYWSEFADITVETRPDLTVENFDYEPGHYDNLERILMSYDIVNRGLVNLPQGTMVTVAVRLSGHEQALSTFELPLPLQAGERRFVQSEITVPAGWEPKDVCEVLNVHVDSTDRIAESNENNNTSGNTSLDVVTTGIEAGEALDVTGLRWERFGAFCRPWIGQTEKALDSEDALAAPLELQDGVTSGIRSTFFVDQDSAVAFSANGESVFRIIRDDETVIVDQIVGIDDPDIWVGHRFDLVGGHFYTLEFVHGAKVIDPETGEERELKGEFFVDRFQVTFPNLEITEFTLDDRGTPYGRDDRIHLNNELGGLNASLKIRNTGERDVTPNTPIEFQFRLSEDQIWGNGDDILIRSDALGDLSDTFRIKLADVLEGGETGLDRDVSAFFSLPMPEYVVPGSYYLGAFVNWGGRISESDTTDNAAFTDAPVVQVESSPSTGLMTLEEGLDADRFPQVLVRRGDDPVLWYSQNDSPDNGSNGLSVPPGSPTDPLDIVRTPALLPGQSSDFELVVTGPGLLRFWWKADTLENSNAVTLYLDGDVHGRLSGQRDWREVEIPLGYGVHTLRWLYTLDIARESEDVVWIENLRWEDIEIDKPDLAPVALDYDPGSYVLQRDNLRITVDGSNLGLPLAGADPGFNVEVRLSANKQWGDGDDHVIGNLELIDNVGQFDRYVHAREFNLDLFMPDGAYYVLAKVDSGERIAEFDESNNVIVSENADVIVDGRPNLTVENVTPVGPQRDLRRGESFRIRFDVRNIGYEAVPVGSPYSLEITFNAESIVDGEATAFPELFALLLALEDREGLAVNEVRSFEAVLQVPFYDDPALIRKYGLGDIIDVEAVEGGGTVTNEISFATDIATRGTPQVPLVQEWNFLGQSIYQVVATARQQDFADFNAEYPGTSDANADNDGDGLTNGQEFAQGTDPGKASVNTFADGADLMLEEDGEQYLSVTFQALSPYANGGAVYIVEAAPTAAFASVEEVARIEPPISFTAAPESHPVDSDKRVSTFNALDTATRDYISTLLSQERIVAALNEGAQLRVTVRDSVPVASVTSRFMRVRIELQP